MADFAATVATLEGFALLFGTASAAIIGLVPRGNGIRRGRRSSSCLSIVVAQ